MSNYSDLTKAVMRGRRLMQGGRTEDAPGLQRQVEELQRQLAEARALINDLNDISSELPKAARYAIESYLEENK